MDLFHQDRDVEEGGEQEEDEAGCGGRGAEGAAEEQADGTEEQGESDEIRPDDGRGDPGGRELLKRDAGDVAGKEKVLGGIKDHDGGEGGAAGAQEEGRRGAAGPEAGGEDQGSGGEGGFAEGEGPEDAVVEVTGQVGQVNGGDDDEEEQGEEGGGGANAAPGDEAEGGGKETGADEVRPEERRGEPVGDDGGEIARSGKVLGGKDGECDSLKDGAEDDEPAGAVSETEARLSEDESRDHSGDACSAHGADFYSHACLLVLGMMISLPLAKSIARFGCRAG